jgi:hypothetical protein
VRQQPGHSGDEPHQESGLADAEQRFDDGRARVGIVQLPLRFCRRATSACMMSTWNQGEAVDSQLEGEISKHREAGLSRCDVDG